MAFDLETPKFSLNSFLEKRTLTFELLIMLIIPLVAILF